MFPAAKFHVKQLLARKHENFGPNELLCQRCSKMQLRDVHNLDLAMFLKRSRYNNGVRVAYLGTYADLQKTVGICIVCETLSKICPANHPPFGTKARAFELRAYPLTCDKWPAPTIAKGEDIRYIDQICLAVVPIVHKSEMLEVIDNMQSRFLLCSASVPPPDKIFSARRIGPHFEASVAKEWLKCCRNTHADECTKDVPPMTGLKLIDCRSLMVVDAPQRSLYAALSYVWGSSASAASNFSLSENNSPTALPSDLPRVISDAITFTKALDLQYLWVDQLCIDQADDRHKLDQINQMDLVYQGAEVTLIAAAGNRAQDGLSGVGSSRKSSQLTVTVHGITLTSIWNFPEQSIISSKWWSRGWVYQEAMLSRRRIIFTEDQVYFECNGTNFQECLIVDTAVINKLQDWPPVISGTEGPLRDTYDIDWLRSRSPSSPNPRPFWKTDERLSLFKSIRNRTDYGSTDILGALQIFQNHVVEYSTRHLTFEDDSWRAFAGIARHLRATEVPAFHIWGLPVVDGVIGDEDGLRHETIPMERLLASLAWVHAKAESIEGTTIKRRCAFPSWTWVGWSGEVKFLLNDLAFEGGQPRAVFIEVSTSDEEQVLLPLSDLQLGMAEHLAFPLAIHLDGLFYHPATCTRGDDRQVGFDWRFDAASARFWLDLAIPADEFTKSIREKRYRFLLLGELWSVYFLVVEPVDQSGDSFSKVGVMEVLGNLEDLEQHVEIEKRRVRLV